MEGVWPYHRHNPAAALIFRYDVHVNRFVSAVEGFVRAVDEVAVELDHTRAKEADDGAEHDFLKKSVLHSGRITKQYPRPNAGAALFGEFF